ncbi:MAG: MOSC N-terminal beta barrel domain-containing protein [Phycisphaerales bacterium]
MTAKITLTTDAMGRVAGIWRYPVKSMLGEALEATDVTPNGLLGDRAFALIDVETGKVVSAKNPRRWPNVFEFRSEFDTASPSMKPVAAARIRLPGGEWLSTADADAEPRLSAALGRPVRLGRAAAAAETAEGYWPDHEWLAHRDEVFDFRLPPGTYFDGASIHLITTATLAALSAAAPTSRFAPARFRPNFVIELDEPRAGASSGGPGGASEREPAEAPREALGEAFGGAVGGALGGAVGGALGGAFGGAPGGAPDAARNAASPRPRAAASDPFVENGWIGRTLALGDVRLRIDGPCPRCVMTTLAQGSLPKDPTVLRTIVGANKGHVGVYATVVRGGRVRRGDLVRAER